jgi:hypothetical protein
MLRRITSLLATLVVLSGSFVVLRAGNFQEGFDNCEVYVIDRRTNRKLMSEKFTTVIGEEELTTKTYSLPGTKSVITASVYYTDESMASKYGADSMQLGIAVGKRALKNAMNAPNAAVAEVTMGTLDTVRTERLFRTGKSNLSIGLMCSKGKHSDIN